MNILAIDPGPSHSAVVRLADRRIEFAQIADNSETIRVLRLMTQATLVVEMIEPRGVAVGAEVFETAYWVGRFVQTWEDCGMQAVRIPRRAVKQYFQAKNDAMIRTAILNEYGGLREIAIGIKKKPGPLYGITKDLWQALALGLYAHTHSCLLV